MVRGQVCHTFVAFAASYDIHEKTDSWFILFMSQISMDGRILIQEKYV